MKEHALGETVEEFAKKWKPPSRREFVPQTVYSLRTAQSQEAIANVGDDFSMPNKYCFMSWN